jgi:hypothetical protein
MIFWGLEEKVPSRGSSCKYPEMVKPNFLIIITGKNNDISSSFPLSAFFESCEGGRKTVP